MPRGEDTRQRILMEALDLFARYGYNAVSINDIAKGTGIRGSSIYNYFSGKAEILDEIVRMFVRMAEDYRPSQELVDRLVEEGDPAKVVGCMAYDYKPEDMALMLRLQRLQYMEYYNIPAIRELLLGERTQKAKMIAGALRTLAEKGKIPPIRYDLDGLCWMLMDSLMVTGLEATVEDWDYGYLTEKKRRTFEVFLSIVTGGLTAGKKSVCVG